MHRVVILGSGESGTGAAILAHRQGFDVFVSDMGSIKEGYKEQLASLGIAWEEGQHTEEAVLSASEVVKSPGIPDTAPLVVKLRERGIPVISEIEFAARFTQAKKLIAITGSNGKTTTTSLIYHMLTQAGLNVGLAGNIGKSFALQVAQDDKPVYVLEISSFQLDGMYQFKADIAVLTNITPDHLNRYNYDFDLYARSKFRITQNQGKADHLVCCADDPVIQDYLQRLQIAQQTNVLQYGFSPIAHVRASEGSFAFNSNGSAFTMNLNELSLAGRHNAQNSMAAAITGSLMGLSNQQIRESLTSFMAVEHRLEEVLTIRGVRFINDSKATNVNSTWYALECMTQPTVLILGGIDKGNDYTELYDLVREKVKAIVCLGVDNTKIKNAFSHLTEVIETCSMQEAVRSAYYLANKNECVLLSPACASFDLFENYEDRGKQFKHEVYHL